jgi:predicted outer membrane repeat protein
LASNGDTVMVPTGPYTESLTLSKAVSLTGVNSATTIIYAVSGQRVLTVTGDVISNSVIISGLTFANGDVTGGVACPVGCGGGILITGTAQPAIQNVVVRNNRAGVEGGGVYVDLDSPLTLTNVSIMSNSALGGGGGLYALSFLGLNGAEFISNTSVNYFGGGVFAWGPTTVNGGHFERNVALGAGGGLYARDIVTLNSVEFINNTTPDGAGVYAFRDAALTGGRFVSNNGSGLYAGGALTLTGTEFIGNTGGGVHAGMAATLNGGRFVNNSGGGLFTWGSLTLTDTEFISNAATGGGGARAYGAVVMNGGRFVNNLSTSLGNGAGGLMALGTLTLSGTEFISNTGWGNGGGVVVNGEATLVGGRFINNHSSELGSNGNGGGIYAYSTLAITGTEFISNSARDSGGAIYHSGGHGRIVNALFARNTAGGNGASLYFGWGSSEEVLYATIADVTINSGQAIYILTGTVGITNTIIANHTTGVERVMGTVYEDYNLYFRNTVNYTGTILSGGHSRNGNPVFVDPANDNYHLGIGSAAIDRGISVGVVTDLDGKSRPLGNGFDIGCYEADVPYRTYLPLVLKGS